MLSLYLAAHPAGRPALQRTKFRRTPFAATPSPRHQWKRARFLAAADDIWTTRAQRHLRQRHDNTQHDAKYHAFVRPLPSAPGELIIHTCARVMHFSRTGLIAGPDRTGPGRAGPHRTGKSHIDNRDVIRASHCVIVLDGVVNVLMCGYIYYNDSCLLRIPYNVSSFLKLCCRVKTFTLY